MTLDIGAETGQRVQAQIDDGAYKSADEVLARALDLLEAEDWLTRNKDRIKADLDETFAQADRGEGYSLEESRALLAQGRASRTG